MPQELNLNVSPYYDDFDRDNDYYRVLFKPGYPVQARELIYYAEYSAKSGRKVR